MHLRSTVKLFSNNKCGTYGQKKQKKNEGIEISGSPFSFPEVQKT